MATTTMVHVRIDENVKAQASETLSSMGLSMSDAIRVFLTKVASEKQLPFSLCAPNAETLQAMAEAEAITRSYHARFQNANELLNDLEKNSRK